MYIQYFYALLLATLIVIVIKITLDYRNIKRLLAIKSKNKKLNSICIIFKYENSLDDLEKQIRELNVRKSKLITVGVLIRNKTDKKTRDNIKQSISMITKNKLQLIEFKNVRGIKKVIENVCDSDLFIVVEKSQHLSKDFIRKMIKIASRYNNQNIFVPCQYSEIGNSLGSLTDARSNLLSQFYKQLFGVKTDSQLIQPGIIYRLTKSGDGKRVPIDSACSIKNDVQETNILNVMNEDIDIISKNIAQRILFYLASVATLAVLIADWLYKTNLFITFAIFVIAFYILLGLMLQLGNKKYSILENICLILIMPITFVLDIINNLLGLIGSLYQSVGKNNKRNNR